jgi:hypothetical protein
MKRFNGGNQVEGGYYWHVGNWEVTTIREKVGTLPGGAEEKYIRTPLPALLVVAPVMGAAFALFLPFIGFAMGAYAAGKRLARTAPGRTAETH